MRKERIRVMLKSPDMVLDYIAIKTEHFEEMVSFYHQVIGMDELNYEDNMVYLGSRRQPLVALIEEEMDRHNSNIDKIAFKMKDKISFDALLNHLNQTHHIQEIHDFGFVHSFLIDDPDGNTLEFYMESDRQQWPEIFPESNLIPYEQTKQSIGCYHLDEGTTLGHLHLKVNSIKETQSFYEQVLDLEHKSTSNQQEFHFAPSLSMAGETLMSIQQKMPFIDHSNIDYVVFQMVDMDALADLKESLEKHHYQFYYNRGKKIIAIDDPNNIPFWFQVRGV